MNAATHRYLTYWVQVELAALQVGETWGVASLLLVVCCKPDLAPLPGLTPPENPPAFCAWRPGLPFAAETSAWLAPDWPLPTQ